MKKVPLYNSCKLKNFKYTFAEKPVKCYKIFKVENGDFLGPFAYHNFGKLKKGSIIEPDKETNTRCLKYPKLFKKSLENTFNWFLFGDFKYDFKNKWWAIREGYIHTLSYAPSDLSRFMLCSWRENKEHFELWECEIPKNTLYFQADTRCSHYETNNSLASKKIKLIKKISECDS